MSFVEIGARAPAFSFHDTDGTAHSLEEFRGEPLIVILAAGGDRAQPQPPLQRLTFDDEQLSVIAASGDVARQYGVTDGMAAFVVGRDGMIVWRQAADGGTPAAPPSSNGSGLTRREFVATILAASLVATFASRVSAVSAATETPA